MAKVPRGPKVALSLMTAAALLGGVRAVGGGYLPTTPVGGPICGLTIVITVGRRITGVLGITTAIASAPETGSRYR